VASKLLQSIRARVNELKRESLTVYFACQDPETPRAAKIVAALVVAYAFSPIDLIPDFVPVLGYIDDMLLVPIGIAIALRMIPEPIRQRARERAAHAIDDHIPVHWGVAVAILAVWALAVAWIIVLITRFL